jgi:hypothetical protein
MSVEDSEVLAEIIALRADMASLRTEFDFEEIKAVLSRLESGIAAIRNDMGRRRAELPTEQ